MLLDPNFVKDNHMVWSVLQDDISRYILSHRILYSLTGDIEYLHKMIRGAVPEIQILNNLSAGIQKSRKYYIFGAGNYAHYVMKFIHADWEGIADNNERLWGETRYSLPVIDPNELPKDAQIYIANNHQWQDIYRQLKELGFADCQIVCDVSRILEQLGERMYFDLPALSLSSDEVFIDGGAYDGFSSKMFARWSSGRYACIYAFEPDSKNRIVLRKNLDSWNEIERIHVIEKGLWNKNETLFFEATGGQGSCISNDGTQSIDVCALDEQSYASKISFIKLDIEGAEYNALQGAEQVIRNYHPKLAISIYHKPEDIFTLPDLILSYYPKYKLYLRHYGCNPTDTVLYAV